MSDSNELRTIKKCSPKLETALNGVESKLVHFLHEEGFITDAIRDEILEPKSLLSEADKASKLVKWIRKSVELDAPKYNILLDWFKAGGPFYKAIVNILHTEYERGTRLAGGELKKDKRKKKQLTAQQGIELQQKTREEEGLIKELQREIALLTDNLTKDEHIRRLQTEKHQLQLQLATQEGHQQGTLESQMQDSRLRETQQREELQRKDVEISRLREEGRKVPQPREETGQVGGIEEDKVSDHQNPSGPVKLTWRRGEPAPEHMSSRYGSAVVHGNTAYFSQNYNVYSYTVPENKWTKLPTCKNTDFAMAVINNVVTSIGGQHAEGLFGILKATNSLLSLIGNTGKEVYPPMPTKRTLPAAGSTSTHLVVAGGSTSVDAALATVEVLNIDTHQWSTARRLPESATNPQLTLCGGRFYLADRNSKILSCSVEELLKSCKPTSTNSSDGGCVWTGLAKIPVKYDSTLVKYDSTLATQRGPVLAIGGIDLYKYRAYDVNLIHSYDVATNSWNAVGGMQTPLSCALAALLPSNELVVVHDKYTEIAS